MMTLEELRSELQGFDNDISYLAKRFRAMQSDIRLTLQRLGEIEGLQKETENTNTKGKTK
jgi:hypothetical protein